MRSFIKTGVVKSSAVAVSFPRLVENEGFVPMKLVSLVKEDTENLEKLEKFDEIDEGKDAKETENETDMKGELILMEAEAKAKEILANADAEAENLRESTLADLEERKQKVIEEASEKAYQEGYAKGLEEGSAKGYHDGLSEGKKEAEKLKQEASRNFELATHLLERQYQRVDDSLLYLAIKMAERILHVNLEMHPEYVLDRIRALNMMPGEREDLKLYLSPNDFKWFEKLPSTEKPDIPTFRDERLKPGDCYLTCSEGIFEANLKDELDLFEKVLREEIEYGRLEQAGR